MELGTDKLKKPEKWRVTTHYDTGDQVAEYDQLNDVLQWSAQAVRQMGWKDRKHSKVTVERVQA